MNNEETIAKWEREIGFIFEPELLSEEEAAELEWEDADE